MRSTLTRAGLVAAAVGSLVVGAVVVGGPASAAGRDPAQDHPGKDVVIGCAVAGEVVVAPSGTPLPAPEAAEAAKGVTGSTVAVEDGDVVRVTWTSGAGGSAEPVPAGAVTGPAVGGAGSSGTPLPGTDGGPVESFEVSVDALPDCTPAH